MKKTAAKGHTTKHTVSKTKHAKTAKHTPAKTTKKATAHKATVTTKAKTAAHAKAVALALGDGVACCAAEALAASLRLAGGTVSDEDVLALYWHTASDPDSGASILATLEAAWRYGLGGVRQAEFGLVGCVSALDEQVVADLGDDLAVLQFGQGVDERLLRLDAAQCEPFVDLIADRPFAHALILDVELPGSHAVLADDGGWWSWGELHDPAEWPDAVVETAWAVTW